MDLWRDVLSGSEFLGTLREGGDGGLLGPRDGDSRGALALRLYGSTGIPVLARWLTQGEQCVTAFCRRALSASEGAGL